LFTLPLRLDGPAGVGTEREREERRGEEDEPQIYGGCVHLPLWECSL